MLNVLFSTSSNNISAIDFEKNECSIENKIEALSKAKILKINSSKKEIISSIIDDDVFNIDGTVLVKNSVKKSMIIIISIKKANMISQVGYAKKE